MMFSVEKCTERSETGTEECDLVAGEGMGNEGVAQDEVAPAVAAVADEIGDILKDELGDADRAERIGAELADLSAELGLLAGLADGEAQPDFTSRFEVPFEWIAMGHRGSGSGSSSSSWSGGRGGRTRRPLRPQRLARRRPIAKGKELCRRRSTLSATAARAAAAREVASDASDVGATTDSDDQWTELDDASGSSDSSSSLKEAAGDARCEFKDGEVGAASAPVLGQFLLPLLSADPANMEPEHFLIRHEDILQLLASAEESARDAPLDDESVDTNNDQASEPVVDSEEPPVTPEEEAALLHYVCESERASCTPPGPLEAVEDWLLGVFHSWCEISALLYTLVPTNMSVEMVSSSWTYVSRFPCHCRLCVSLACGAAQLQRLLRHCVTQLAHGGLVSTAAGLVRALKLRSDGDSDWNEWELHRLQRLHVNDAGAAIFQEQMEAMAGQSEIAAQIVKQGCECRAITTPFQKEYAFERFCRILENFKAASTITFKVELVPSVLTAESAEWARRWSGRVQRALTAHQGGRVAQQLRDMRTHTQPARVNAWSGYKHRCDCLTPRTLCAEQRKQLLRISFFGMMQAVNEMGDKDQQLDSKDVPGSKCAELSARLGMECDALSACDRGDGSDSNRTADLDDLSDTDGKSDTASLGISSCSSLDSASELLLAAAAAVDSGGSEGEAGGRSLCRTVRHLMRSISSIERLMDRVLKHCDDWPAPPQPPPSDARKRVDAGLSEVDRKLMAMYRRLPDVHRRQLHVYRNQQKLSTVCQQLVGGTAPLPPPPGSPPPVSGCKPAALCPEYHLQRFREVRRKVMHMRDQQLYYHRLRMWLEEQLRTERESVGDSSVSLVEDRSRRPAAKRKLRPAPAIAKPHRVLQLLRHRTHARLDRSKDNTDDDKPEVPPPEAFPLDRDDNVSDTDTIVGEKETDMCKDMKDCLAKFANFALSNENEEEVKYPDSISPPLQEMSPTTSEPMPVYTAPKPNQRLLSAKLLNRRVCDMHENVLNHKEQSQITPEVMNVPLNARNPLLFKDMKEEDNNEIKLAENENSELIIKTGKDPNIYKYVSFGIEIKKAMEECQNIINSYSSIKEDGKEKDDDGPLSLEQICEVMMNLDSNSVEFLDKMDSDEPIDLTTNTKLAELVENMPQILANMPEITTKLSEFANASFELPEFASIMNTLPDVNNEAQLTPETLKQIRELKLSKSRDSVKVTKNTAKRKTTRRIKNNIEPNNVIGTMTFEFDSKEITDLLKDEKELQALMKNKSNNKEDFKDLLFSISAQVVINKVFEYLKLNKSPELAKCLEEDKELFSLPKNSINSEMYSKASTLFDNSVKDALSMDELRDLVKSRFNSWKHYVATKFKSIPVELLDNEIEAMLDKFYSYIQDLAGQQCANDSDKIIEKIDEIRRNNGEGSDTESCPAGRESWKQITRLLSTSAGNTFDLLIMKLSKMSQDKKSSVKSLKFKYLDVIRRCAESQQLAGWILLNPEIAANVIQELTGLPARKNETVPDFNTMSKENKRDYFIDRLREMNRLYMESLPKKGLTGDEWLVMLYRLEQLEEKLKDSCSKVNPPTKNTNQNVSEAEILAAKGLSKIIGKANVKIVKKPEQKKEEDKNINKDEKEDKQLKNEALLAKCEAILTTKGEKSLLDSFYTIKSYITQGLPVPETYKKHVISICSSIDAKLLDEDTEEAKVKEEDAGSDTKEKERLDKANLAILGSQNPELLAKYSAQALRNAKQTLNAVAFRNMVRNGQSKSESDACDTPKIDCKWTNDCVCNSCKGSDNSAILQKLAKHCFEEKTNEEGKKEKVAAKPVPKSAKPPAKCENASHQQHVCKVGHSNGPAACAGDAGADQPCTCCYCTVFGHAPPLTTPVPRNFNETRERLRSILNKKKQKCKTNGDGEHPPLVEKKPVLAPIPIEVSKPPQPPQPKPPALPKTLPPSLTPAQTQAQIKRQNMELQQKQLADKMAKMVVSDKQEAKPKALQRTVPIQVNVSPAIKAEGKVNPNAMEQIRLQQLKQQQQAQLQQQAQQQQQEQQKKPEPIYDLPIHNKPTLTPQQQQQIRLQQQKQQEQQRQRPQQRAVSLSSRDTSVFSTSSGCDGESCWRGSRTEDPRDLDALLQYIEGPARHVDRGKKRAKKERQKAKRTQARLAEQHIELSTSLLTLRRALEAARAHHAAQRRRVDEARKKLDQLRTKKKGKKAKISPAQQAKVQQLAEELGEVTAVVNAAAKDVAECEQQMTNCVRNLAICERELREARALLGGEQDEETMAREAEMLQKVEQQRQQHHQFRQQQQQREQQELQQQQLQQQQLQQQQLQQQQLQMMEREKQQAILKCGGAGGAVIRVRRAAGGVELAALAALAPGPVSVSVPVPVAAHHLLQQGRHLTVLNVCESEQQAAKAEKKQTWEQALAHINQLAKSSKEKKKKEKEQKQEKAKEQQRSASLPDSQALSKKQRKLLLKQQAEEEERRRQQELEAKTKKAEAKKQEAAKAQDSKKEKKAEKKQEVAKKKEDKKEAKKENKEKKGKENKQEKAPPVAATKQNKQPAPAQPSKKEKKKEQRQQQAEVTNITNKLPQPPSVPPESGRASCSIMEQLSSGVQVQDLRLPPGITLTRVAPRDQRDVTASQAAIRSVPVWKSSQLAAAPTPVARPPPVINADPNMMMFSTAAPEQPKTIIIPEPAPPSTKSKKSKKKSKKAASEEPKTDGTKMVTLRNPMFHPNLPPVQVTNPVQKKQEIRIPDPIPMPPNACQATITPTSNGMYTIRNPLMSMMHQQSLMGIRSQTPQMNPMYSQPQYNYVNPNVYNPVQNVPQTYVIDPARSSPKNDEFQSRIMNLASFTQKNDDGYSLFKTTDDSQQRNFLAPEYFENNSPKPTVSPNPIGTRPSNDCNRSFDSNDSSLFANPIQRPEPIGTPLKRDEERSDYSSLYTPFGQEDRNVFRNALFNDKNESNLGKMDDLGLNHLCNGDPLPYFQRLRVGSKLNNEVTIHHVTESKFYKGQEPVGQPEGESLFSRPAPGPGSVPAWPEGLYSPAYNNNTGVCASPPESARESPSGASPPQRAAHAHTATDPSVFLPDRSITNLSSLEVSEREIESFKRFDFYFEPPHHKPKVQLDVRDIANALRQHHK